MPDRYTGAPTKGDAYTSAATVTDHTVDRASLVGHDLAPPPHGLGPHAYPDDPGNVGGETRGGLADLPGALIDFAAKLDIQLGKVAAAQSALADQMKRWRAETRTPSRTKIPFSFTFQSGLVNFLPGAPGIGVQIGGPEIGYQWSVRQIVIGGNTLTGAPAGVGWFLETPSVPSDQSPTSVMDFTHAALPQVAFYGEGEFQIGPGSNLWIIITGGTNGVQYSGSVLIQQSVFGPVEAEVTV